MNEAPAAHTVHGLHSNALVSMVQIRVTGEREWENFFLDLSSAWSSSP